MMRGMPVPVALTKTEAAISLSMERLAAEARTALRRATGGTGSYREPTSSSEGVSSIGELTRRRRTTTVARTASASRAATDTAIIEVEALPDVLPASEEPVPPATTAVGCPTTTRGAAHLRLS
jgi:hypothetical protein